VAPTLAAGATTLPDAPVALVVSPEASLAGAVLAERYDVIDLLGRGGMGEVYRARDRELDEVVALKVLRPELSSRADVVERFRNEVKLARRVTHRAVARTFELGTAAGLRFLTMEFVDGEPLSHVLARRAPLDAAWCARIGAEVCAALAAAHEAGVVHRDVKPDNVMLTRDGRVVVTDFGIARLASDGGGDLAGTPAYMAPEQVQDRPPTAQSDLYALGVLLFEALTGRLPFEAPSALASLALRIGRPPPDPRALRPEVPPELAQVVTTAMAEHPHDRFATAAAMRGALQASVAPRSMPPSALGIEVRGPGPRAWTTVAVRGIVDAPLAVRHLTSALVDELTLSLGRVPRLRLSVSEEPDADVVVSPAVAGDHLTCEAVAAATGQVIWAGRAALAARRVPAAAEIFTRSLALALDAADPGPPPPCWPSDAALDALLRARLLFHGPVATELREAEQLLAAAVRAEADREPRARAAAVSGTPTEADIDAVGSGPLLAMFARASLRVAFFSTDERAPIALAEHAVRVGRDRAPDRPEVHLAAGHLALHLGDPVAAARSFREALRAAPAWSESHEWLGRMLLEAGAIADGARRAETAIRLDPRLGPLRWEIARAHALEGSWSRLDAELARLAASMRGLHGRWLARLRWAAWRAGPDAVAATLDEMRAVPVEDRFEPEICALFAESVVGRSFRRWAPVVRARMLGDAGGSARRRAIVLQVAAEAAFASGELDEGLAMLEGALGAGLFDLHWLDRCPLLDVARGAQRFAAVRAMVEQRALAIGDALFGE
jgi:serine/threonine-protein kinase